MDINCNPGPSAVNTLDPNFDGKIIGLFDDIPSSECDRMQIDELSDFTDNDSDIGREQSCDPIVEATHYSDLSDIDDTDADEDYVLESNHSTDTEIDYSSSEEDIVVEESNTNYYYGKDRTKWSKTIALRQTARTPAHNILKLPSVRERRQCDAIEPLEAWEKIFTNTMSEKIVIETNKKLQSIRLKYKNLNKSELRDCTLTEIKAFFGLLVYSAVFKSNKEDMRSLFATDGTGRDRFRCVMSVERFSILVNFLRFDNKDDREERLLNDPTAAISEILEMFNANCQSSYSLGSNATADEMLIGFRGRCRGKVYMPSKPKKYGLKLQCVADARTSYVYNTYLYFGKDTDGLGLSREERKYLIPTQALIRLCKPIFNSNRNVTCDNWYTSVEAANVLKKNGLTLVGTLKKNKTAIPPEFQPSANRLVGETKYGYSKDITIISHVPKKRKSVILLSTMHHYPATDNVKGIPEIISYYNNTKGGVDSLDEKCAKYCTGRRTRRWTMAIFFRILDMSCVNAYLIHQSYRNRLRLKRLKFMKCLAEQLTEPVLKERLHNKRLPRLLRELIGNILKVEIPGETEDDSAERLDRNNRKTCFICPSKKRRKTSYLCFRCKKPICLECCKKVCVKCVERKE